MKRDMGLTGERSNHKLAGIFPDAEQAEQCRKRIEASTETPLVIDILNAESGALGRRLEPESRGIWHTLVRSHVWLAMAGAGAGLIIFALMVFMNVAFVVQNLLPAAALLVFFCAVGGAMIGGLVTLRPDHSVFNAAVSSALSENRHVVIVHPTTSAQIESARACLKQFADQTVATL